MGLARDLPTPPADLRYFHIPPRRAGAGPGWYMENEDGELFYLGYSSASAEVELLQRLRAEEAAAT